MKTNEAERPEGCPHESCDECDGVLLREDGVRGEVARPCPVYIEKKYKTSEERWLAYVERKFPHMRKMLDAERQLSIPFELEADEEKRAEAEGVLERLQKALVMHTDAWGGPQPHKGIVLVGPVGSGKTSIAISLALRYVQITHTWIEVAVEREMLMNFSVSFRDTDAELQRTRYWRRLLPAFFLDDIGTKMKYTEAQLDELNNLLMHHYDKGHLLILTTNKPFMDEVDEFGNVIEKGLVGDGIIDDRLASRLMESCMFYSTYGIPDWRMLTTNL